MNSFPFIESIIKNGSLSPAELLRYFMVGLGTDADGIMAVLANRSAEDIRHIAEEYSRRYPPGRSAQFLGNIPYVRDFILLGYLQHDLHVELTGDLEFDVSLLLEGLPKGCTERELCDAVHSRLTRRYNHENSGAILRRIKLNYFRGDTLVRNRFEEDYAAALDFYMKQIGNTLSPDPEMVKRFLVLARITEIHANNYRHVKRSLGEVVLNSMAFIGALTGAASVFHLLSFSYYPVAAAAFAGSLTWRLMSGRFILGESFGRNDAIFQTIRASIDGGSMFTVRLGLITVGRFVGSQLSKMLAKSGFKLSLNTQIKILESKIRGQNKARHVLRADSAVKPDRDLLELVQRCRAQLGFVAGMAAAAHPQQASFVQIGSVIYAALAPVPCE